MLKNHDKMDYFVDEYDNVLGFSNGKSNSLFIFMFQLFISHKIQLMECDGDGFHFNYWFNIFMNFVCVCRCEAVGGFFASC